MLNETLAQRYSVALYALAHNTGEAGQQLRELEVVTGLLAEHRNLRQALESPTIPREVKKSIVGSLLSGRVSGRTLQFVRLVVDKGREKLIADIVACFRKQLKEQEGIIDAKVEVAAELEPALEALVKMRLLEITGKKVQMEVVVRPELVGGAVITLGDHLYDGSVRYHLDEIRECLSGR